jgi:hypothetical protein
MDLKLGIWAALTALAVGLLARRGYRYYVELVEAEGAKHAAAQAEKGAGHGGH